MNNCLIIIKKTERNKGSASLKDPKKDSHRDGTENSKEAFINRQKAAGNAAFLFGKGEDTMMDYEIYKELVLEQIRDYLPSEYETATI